MKITTVIDNRIHNGGPVRSPVIIYLRTKRGKNSTHLHSGLRAGSQWRLTVNSRSTPQLPMSPANGRHPPTTPPQRSCHQVEACCWARIPQATWHMEGTSTLIGANHSVLAVTERVCGTGAALGQSQEHGPGVWCKAIHIVGFGARRFHSGAPDSGDDASLRGGAPPCPAGPIKDRS